MPDRLGVNLLTSCLVNRRSEKRKAWTDEGMEAAMKAVEEGELVNQAVWNYGIHKTTLLDHISGRVIHGVKLGPRPYLSPQLSTT